MGFPMDFYIENCPPFQRGKLPKLAGVNVPANQSHGFLS